MKNILFVFISLTTLLIMSCEDEAPGAYKESYIVNALLLVDMPISEITVLRSLPIFDKYNNDSAKVKNATITIEGDDNIFNLKYRLKEDGNEGYYAEDSIYKVKPNTLYKIKITLPNGNVINGETTTPGRISWVKKAKDYLQYPKDSLKLPSTDTISWNKVTGNDFYLISVSCLDTLQYGKYLTPKTEELNRRVYFPIASEKRYRELTTISPIANTHSSVVWAAFKWFGLHQVKVFAPDYNFLKWFIQSQVKQELDPLLSSVQGNAYGFFGSASLVADTTFLLKNQP